MGGHASSISSPLRRFLRFSVRGLIILVLLIGLWLGWFVRCARIQREAVAAIQHAGGKVAYDWEWSNGKPIPGGKPSAPQWLIDLIGVDYFGHVTFAWLKPNETDDSAIAQVGRLARLQLKDLTNLTVVLDVMSTQVTDMGVRELRRALPNPNLIIYR